MPTTSTKTNSALIAVITARLASRGIASARLDTLLLLEAVTGHDRAYLLAHPEAVLTSRARRSLETKLRRREQREPLAYILGHVEFYGLTFAVSPVVLIPRPETENLVELALKYAPTGAQVLEVGTGSGAIAVALTHRRPDLRVTASDLSDEALAVARHNAQTYLMDDIDFQKSNLMNDIKDQYNVVVANLPYLADDKPLAPELSYEPVSALFGGPDGLSLYRQLLVQVGDQLKCHGVLIIEAEPAQHPPLKRLARQHGLQLLETQGLGLAFQSNA